MIESPDNGAATDLAQALLALRSVAVKSRADVEGARRWEDCERAYANVLYEDVRMPEWKARATAPKVWEAVERLIPVMTDSKPKLAVGPFEESDNPLSQRLQQAADYEWDRQGMSVEAPKLLRGALIYGTYYLLTRVEVGPFGPELKTDLISPWNGYPDPAATSDKDLAYFIVHRYATSSTIRRLFPEQADSIFEECQPEREVNRGQFFRSKSKANSGTPVISTAGTSTSPTNPAYNYDPNTKHSPEATFSIWEYYFKDGADLLSSFLESQGDAEHGATPPSFPQGAIATMVGNYVVPVDGQLVRPNPFWHGEIPVTRMSAYDLPGEYHAMSFVEPLIDVAELISEIDNQVVNWLKLVLNPMLVIDEQCNVLLNNLYTHPGMILPVDVPPGKTIEQVVQFIRPPEMPAYLWQLRAAKVQEFNDASGISDISRGNFSGPMGQDTSGKAIQLLQEPTYTRIRLMLRNFEASVSRWGKQTVSNLMQFWPVERWDRLLNLPPGEPLGWEGWTPQDRNDLPDVVMSVGSSLPANKDQAFNRAIVTAQNWGFGDPHGPIASEQILAASGIDHPEKVQAQVAAQAAQAAQAQAEAQAAAMGAAQQSTGNGPPPGNDKGLGLEASPAEQMGVAPGSPVA